MTEYSNTQLFGAIEMIGSSALAKHNNFDQTLIAIIVDVTGAESKNYRIQYNGNTFDAQALKADENYEVNEQVYFMVPSGDWSTRKLIIGKCGNSDKKGTVYKQPFSNMIKATQNLLDNTAKEGLRITPTDNKAIVIDSTTYISHINDTELLRYGGLRKTEEFGDFDYIGLSFKVKDAVFNPNNTSGTYGIMMDLKLNKVDDSETPEDYDYYTSFSSNQFFGNPYWCSGMTQELLISYPKGREVKGIRLYLYQDGNFNKPEDVEAIKFTDIELYFGYRPSRFTKTTLVQYIPSNRSLEYSYNATLPSCPAYYALYHDGKIYKHQITYASKPKDLEITWYKFQAGAASTSLAGPNYVILYQSDKELLDDYKYVKLKDQAEIRIKAIVYTPDATTPLCEHILNFNNTDSVITAEEESKIASSLQGGFQVKTYHSLDSQKYNTKKFYLYDSVDNCLVNNQSQIELEVFPNNSVLPLTKGKITYNILSSIPRVGEEETSPLATQLGYFANKTYTQEIETNAEDGSTITETITIPYWTPLSSSGDVLYKKAKDENGEEYNTEEYDFSKAATITFEYDYTSDPKVEIPAAAIKLQKYLFPHRDNRIECTIAQDNVPYTQVIDIDFDISNTAGTGYSLVISPEEGYFEYGMQIANYLYKDKDENNNLIKTYKLKAEIFDSNHNLIKDEAVYEKIAWNIINPNIDIIANTQPEGALEPVYNIEVVIGKEKSTLIIHMGNNTSMINEQHEPNFMIATASISGWTSENNISTTLKTKYPLATFGCFNALYYSSGDYNTKDVRLNDYKYENDLITQFAYACPSRIYYDPFGTLITKYDNPELKVLPVKGEKAFEDVLEDLTNIVNKNTDKITNLNLSWTLTYNEGIDFKPIQIQKNKLVLEKYLMSSKEIYASIGLLISYERSDKDEKGNVREVQPYYLYQQPILIERSHNSSDAINNWDGKTVKIDEKDGNILSSSMIAGSKNIEGQFTGVMMGNLKIQSEGTYSSGIYGFNKDQNRFYLNNNAEFFVGDNKRFIKFNNEGLNIKLKASDIFDLTQDENNFIRMDKNCIQINNFKFEEGRLVATGDVVSKAFSDLIKIISDKTIVRYEIIISTNEKEPVWEIMHSDSDFSWFYGYLSQAILKCAVNSAYGVGVNVYSSEGEKISRAFFGTKTTEVYYPLLDLDLDGNGYIDSTDARLLLQYKEKIAERKIIVSINPTLNFTSKGFIQVENVDNNQIFSIGSEGLRTTYGKFIGSIIIGQEKGLSENVFNDQKMIVNGNGYFNGKISANEFNNNSDPIIKTNIISTKTTNALALVQKLKLYDYNLKENGTAIKLGLMSTEAPEAILGEDKKSINIYSYCGLLAKAIQELSNKLREKGVLD